MWKRMTVGCNDQKTLPVVSGKNYLRHGKSGEKDNRGNIYMTQCKCMGLESITVVNASVFRIISEVF